MLFFKKTYGKADNHLAARKIHSPQYKNTAHHSLFGQIASTSHVILKAFFNCSPLTFMMITLSNQGKGKVNIKFISNNTFFQVLKLKIWVVGYKGIKNHYLGIRLYEISNFSIN